MSGAEEGQQASNSRAIYIDIDDVLSQTSRLLNDMLYKHHNRRVDYESLTDFDLGVSYGLEPHEVDHFLGLVHAPEAIEAISVVDGAVPALEHWSASGYKVQLLTGRPPHTEAATRSWLDRHTVPHQSLSFVDKYGRAASGPEGVPVLSLDSVASMDFCLAVEDSLEVAAFLAERLEIEVVLMDQPWNRDVSHLASHVRERLVRCRGWGEVMQRFPTP